MSKVVQINVENTEKDRLEEARRETQKILGEYSNYIIAEVDASQTHNLEERGFVVWERTDFRKIVIGDVEFEVEENRGELGLTSFGSDDDFYVLQFVAPVKDEWVEMLEKLGVDCRDYLSDNVCVVKIGFHTVHQVSSIRNMEFIRFITKYVSDFKISSELKGRNCVLPLAEFKTLKIVPDSIPYNELGNITVELHDSAYLFEVNQFIVEQGGTIIGSGKDFLRVAIDPSSNSIEKIAELKGVVWIESYREPTFDLDISARIVRADPHIWITHSLDGKNQVIAIADTGLDTGHPYLNMHADFKGRIDAILALSARNSPPSKRRNYASDEPLTRPGKPWKVNRGHGTHVAGIVLGSGASSGGRIKGIAPGATLVFQSIMDNHKQLTGIPEDLYKLFKEAYDLKARIHNNSWGVKGYGRYDYDSRRIDRFVWDKRDMVIVFSAGNAGTDKPPSDGVVDTTSLNNGSSTAKNCIVVGGSENYKPDLCTRTPNSTWGSFHNSELEGLPNKRVMDAYPLKNDPWADNAEGMMAISSRGPTQDGRVKPDIVAPGSCILSTKSSLTEDIGSWGVSPSSKYMYMGGTSMAAPHVSGAAAIVRQYLGRLRTSWEIGKKWRKKVNDPNINIATAALVKAILIHGAKKLKGHGWGSKQNDAEDHLPSSVGRIPNNSQGFGRLDLLGSLFPPAPVDMEIFDGDRVTTGRRREYQFLVQDVSEPFKATLVWTDHPAPRGSARILVNDLDLIVYTPDHGASEFHGNFVDPQIGYNAAPGPNMNVDILNNVEKVIIKKPVPGIYRIVIRGDRVKSKYRTPGGQGQEYALVISADMTETLTAIIGYPNNPGKLPGKLPWHELCNKKPRRPNPKTGLGPLVRRDKRAELVKHLQEMLVELWYFEGSPTGTFDETTENAVGVFQDDHYDWEGNRLKLDGKVGPLTCDSLNRELVGRWYEMYVTPLELTGETFLVIATKHALRKGIKVPSDPIREVKIVVKHPPIKRITLRDPHKNRFAFHGQGKYEVLDKDEIILHNGSIPSTSDIEITYDVQLPFTVELHVGNTDYTFYGKEK